MRRWEARCPECTCVSMKPGATSRPRASISASTAPSKRRPTWRTRSFSYTTTPSGMRVWVWPAKPTTHPPRTRVLNYELREPLPSPPVGERDEDDALGVESGGADPARLRDVDHDA